MKKYSFRKPNSERERPVVSIRMTWETKKLAQELANKYNTSIANIMRTGLLILKTLLEDHQKIYNMINTCIWTEIVKYIGYQYIPTKKCIENHIEQYVREAEKI